MIIAFIFGVFISKYRVTNLHDETLHKPIITKISGNIESIKPTIIGEQIVLNNIKIEKINRNLQKVKIQKVLLLVKFLKHFPQTFSEYFNHLVLSRLLPVYPYICSIAPYIAG